MVCSIFLSALKSTYCCVWPVFRYRIQHITVCGFFCRYWTVQIVWVVSLSVMNWKSCHELSYFRDWTVTSLCVGFVVTEIDALFCVVTLSVLICTNCSLGCVCRYWTVKIVVCGPSVGTEIYTFLYTICLSVLKEHNVVWGMSVFTKMY